jgi:translation initiation factor 2 subunit 1
MIIPKKTPNVGDMVLVKINKVMQFGAYCELTEYGVTAYLPIREVASGWIKNIHEFIKEGQSNVAKVTYIDYNKNAVDISLKKVREKDKKDKINLYNLEKRAYGMFKQALTLSKSEENEEKIKTELAKTFVNYNDIVVTIAEKSPEFENTDVNTDFKNALTAIIEKTIKQKIYKVSYNIEMNINDTNNGIKIIKKVLSEIAKTGIFVTYAGAPNYHITANGDSYPNAEEKIKKAQEILQANISQAVGVFSLKKEKV